MLSPVEVTKKIISIRIDAHGESEDRALSRLIALGPVLACQGAALPVGLRDDLARHENLILSAARDMAKTQGHPEADYVAKALLTKDFPTWTPGFRTPRIWRERVQALIGRTGVNQATVLREALRRGLESMEKEQSEAARGSH